MATQILEWTCPLCKRVISSIYRRQFDHNISEHKDSHKAKEVAKN